MGKKFGKPSAFLNARLKKPRKKKPEKIKVVAPKIWESSKHVKYESFVDLPAIKKQNYLCCFGVPVHKKCSDEKGIDHDEWVRVKVINHEIDAKFVVEHMPGGIDKECELLLAERKLKREG